MESFADILNSPVSDFKQPEPLPPGHYRVMWLPKTEIVKARTTGTEGLQFTCRLMQPMPDVDATKLAPDWNERELNYTIYVTAQSKWRLREFFEQHLRMQVDGRTSAQLRAEIGGKTSLVLIKTEVAKKNGQPDPTGRLTSFIDSAVAEPA